MRIYLDPVICKYCVMRGHVVTECMWCRGTVWVRPIVPEDSDEPERNPA